MPGREGLQQAVLISARRWSRPLRLRQSPLVNCWKRIRQDHHPGGAAGSHPQRTHPHDRRPDRIRVPERQKPGAPTPTERRHPQLGRPAGGPGRILSAAERHLVFGTLHTSSAAQTVDRMVDVFPPEQQTRSVCSSRAVWSLWTPCRRQNPAEGQFGRVMPPPQLYSQIQTGGEQGMQTLEKALANLVLNGDVSRAEAMGKASKPGELQRLIGEIDRP